MAQRTAELERWWTDRWFLAALLLALIVRVVPLIWWFQLECIRDECIYRGIALELVDGKGLTVANKGWLPAPGYPFLLAASKIAFGTMQPVKIAQVVLSVFSVGCVYGIGRMVADRRTARIAAFLFALNPTLAWFTNTLWIETIYIFFLLAAGYSVLRAQRSGRWGAAAVTGGLLAGAVLFRGIATYLPPLYVLALIWPGPDARAGDVQPWIDTAKARWRSVLAFSLAFVLTVMPWSIYGSLHYGGPMVSDATVGHVMFLGNNDFPPLTFDYGNGMLTQSLYGRYLKTGRRPCKRSQPPVRSGRCEVQQAIAWAKRHPDKFVARIPMRLAQILNPNSFLTRHLRWGYWEGIPWWAKEALVALILLFSMAATTLGTVAAWARARGPWAWVAVGTTLYTLGVTAVMYGMTRFRLPLEALWVVYLAMFLADPRGVIRDLQQHPWRLTGALLTLPPILALTLWYLPTGYPMFWR